MKWVENIFACFRPSDVHEDLDVSEFTRAPSASQISSSPRRFTLAQCRAMTDNFSKAGMLGRGSFGSVYRGMWVDGRKSIPVAVKRLDPKSSQGQEEWINEILLLGTLEHANIARLIGYCSEDQEALLVYELCSNGSVADAIFQEHAWMGGTLAWSARVQIARDVAVGLEFLHSNRIIHRDFKAANVLLTADMRARITDLGISRNGGEGEDTHVSTRILGTLGYLDPAYATAGHLTYASDAYAFGVLLLELITGQHAMTEAHGHILRRVSRHLFARPQPCVSQFIDESLLGNFNEVEARCLAIIAKHCLVDDPASRPTMSSIVAFLDSSSA